MCSQKEGKPIQREMAADDSRRFSPFSSLQELDQIEEHYKQETRDLLSTVKRLQDENRKLASSLAAATEQQRDSAFSEDGMTSC